MFKLFSASVQAGLCQPRWKSRLLVFSCEGSIIKVLGNLTCRSFVEVYYAMKGKKNKMCHKKTGSFNMQKTQRHRSNNAVPAQLVCYAGSTFICILKHQNGFASVQACLCRTWSETLKTSFPVWWLKKLCIACMDKTSDTNFCSKKQIDYMSRDVRKPVFRSSEEV